MLASGAGIAGPELDSCAVLGIVVDAVVLTASGTAVVAADMAGCVSVAVTAQGAIATTATVRAVRTGVGLRDE